jgi:hypothetical protein
MSELTFAQSERRNYLVPGLIVLAIVAIAAALIYKFTPHRIADVTVTHTTAVPIHTVTPSPIKLSAANPGQDDLYVLATVRIDDKLKLPLFIKDITGTLTTPDGEDGHQRHRERTSSTTSTPPFHNSSRWPAHHSSRETAIQPNDHAEGMVLLHFPVDQATWDKRTSATITITTYSQGDLTVTIPKS